MTIGEVGRSKLPDVFLKSQRELMEQAKLRAMVTAAEKERGVARRSLSKKEMRATMKSKVARKVRTHMMKELVAEVRQRAGEGYSARQLIKSPHS